MRWSRICKVKSPKIQDLDVTMDLIVVAARLIQAETDRLVKEAQRMHDSVQNHIYYPRTADGSNPVIVFADEAMRNVRRNALESIKLSLH